MAGWAVAILYVALFLNWFGMASGSCTMSADHQSITGIVFSAPFYLLGLCLAWFAKPGGGCEMLLPAAVARGGWRRLLGRRAVRQHEHQWPVLLYVEDR